MLAHAGIPVSTGLREKIETSCISDADFGLEELLQGRTSYGYFLWSTLMPSTDNLSPKVLDVAKRIAARMPEVAFDSDAQSHSHSAGFIVLLWVFASLNMLSRRGLCGILSRALPLK